MGAGKSRNNLEKFNDDTYTLVLLNMTNKEIVLMCSQSTSVCQHINWRYLCLERFPEKFQGRNVDAVLQEMDAIVEHLPQPFVCSEKMISKEVINNAMACKCFYYWTKGWSKVLRGHTNSVYSVIKLNETTIVSGSWDTTLRVWDLSDMNNVTSRPLAGHNGIVTSVIKLNDTTIVSGSHDYNLRVWDLTDMNNVTSRPLAGHNGIVRSVIKLNETTIISGSGDTTLRVWDLTNDTSRVLRGHTSSVWSVMKLNETTIVSGSSDYNLRVWDLTNDTSQVLRGHTKSVNSVMKLNETTIVSGSGDTTLRVWYGVR